MTQKIPRVMNCVKGRGGIFRFKALVFFKECNFKVEKAMRVSNWFEILRMLCKIFSFFF